VDELSWNLDALVFCVEPTFAAVTGKLQNFHDRSKTKETDAIFIQDLWHDQRYITPQPRWFHKNQILKVCAAPLPDAEPAISGSRALKPFLAKAELTHP